MAVPYGSHVSVPASPELPRRLLADVLLESRLHVGSRVLLIGCDSQPFVQFLEELSLSVDVSPHAAADAGGMRLGEPRLQVRVMDLSAEGSVLGGAYHLIVVRHAGVLGGNLLREEAWQLTEELLGCLVPTGQLAFVGRVHPQPWPFAEHDSTCYARHLQRFTTNCGVHHYPDEWLSPRGWQWWQRGRQRAGYYLVTCQSGAAALREGFSSHKASGLVCCGAGLPAYGRAA